MKIVLLWLLALGIISNTLFAQKPATDTLQPTLVVERLPAEPFMIRQVTHLSDFVRRFNGQQTGDGFPMTDSIMATFDRKKAIDALFDQQSTKEGLRKYRSTFLETVQDTTSTPLLPYPPENTWAVFDLWVSLDGKAPQPIRCTLRFAPLGKGYAWIWTKAEANFLQTTPKNKVVKNNADSLAYVAPNAHETQFLDVFNLIKYQKDLRYSTPNPNEPPGSISALNSLVAEGRITAAYTTPPHLYMPIGKVWMISLFFQNRSSDNSGWLIEDLFLLPNDQKNLSFPPQI